MASQSYKRRHMTVWNVPHIMTLHSRHCFQETHKYICMYAITHQYNYVGSWNSQLVWKRTTCLFYQINIMIIDGLAMQGATSLYFYIEHVLPKNVYLQYAQWTKIMLNENKLPSCLGPTINTKFDTMNDWMAVHVSDECKAHQIKI